MLQHCVDVHNDVYNDIVTLFNRTHHTTTHGGFRVPQSAVVGVLFPYLFVLKDCVASALLG